MPFAAGDKFGPYEIISPLGGGGMGEVYRARDTRLGRDVAIKVLPPEFSASLDRLSRFEQEARSASALNHPNIITVFDIGSAGGTSYIAMELVEGKSLREMLVAGALPLRKAVSIAAQFADGLAKAHEAGILHRDLKPENLMISQDGFVKILDFGLAKPVSLPSAKVSGLSTLVKTDAGMILGTVGYMSPEQAAGNLVDFQSDQFSFGSILYEMVTGKRAFSRDTAVQSLSAIIQEDPQPVGLLSPQTPAPIRWIIERCLAKEPRERYASTRDLARELRSVQEHFSDLTSSTEIRPSGMTAISKGASRSATIRRILPWLLLAALSAILVVLLVRKQPIPKIPQRSLEISLQRGYQLVPDAPPVLAPDGSAIVCGARDMSLKVKLWLRRLDRFESVMLEGTEGASHPFWSPDSKSIAFFTDADKSLRRLDIASGGIQVICKTTANPFARGGSWGSDGTILFAPSANSPIQRVSATGGEPHDVTKLDPSILDGSHRYPIFLPDAHHFLFTLWSNHLETAAKMGGIYLASFEKGVERRLTSDLSQAVLAGNDRILVHRNDALVSLSFDMRKFEVTGSAEQIASHPLYSISSGSLAASASKAEDIAYALASGEGTGQLTWLDRSGAGQGAIGHQRFGVLQLALAPDGNRFAAEVVTRSGSQVWAGDAAREMLTQLTRGGLDTHRPILSPDGSQIAFMSEESEGSQSVYLQPSDGSRAPQVYVTDKARQFTPSSWSSDGKFLLLDSNAKSGSGRQEIWLYDFTEKKARPILADPAASLSIGVLSPDGKFLAYVSDESGSKEIYVRPFPSLDRKWQLSQGGGDMPHWRSDGREIIYIATDRSVHAVRINMQNGSLEVASPELLFAPRFPIMALAPSPDHNRFLAAIVPGDVVSEPIRIILGWHR
jgi:eukaryotic-like serine/threonine-protein kinase